MATPYISMAGIGKSFGPVHALKSVNLTVYPGEIHALLGENGAGKSTLMKVLSGIHEPTKGTITINNINYNKLDHKLAAQLGIGIIYQELSVIDELTVLENLYIGRHLTKKICGVNIIDWREMRVRAAMMLLRVGLKVDLDEKVANLSISHKQMLEIAKTLMLDAKVIIMDEPTSSLTNKEVDYLFLIMNQLRKEGTAIVYISHSAILALSGMVTAKLMLAGIDPFLAALIGGVLVGGALGAINGCLVNWTGLHPFIITLGTNAIFRGITLVISDANSVYGFSFDFVNFFAASVIGIPVPVIFSLIVALILWFLTTRMRLGRNIYALGGNKNSAFYSGIDVKFHILVVFIISGVCAGLAGVVSTARLGAAEPLAGMGFETYAIASAIIGGTSFFGGKGRIFSVVIGGLIIGTINNGLNILQVQTYYQLVVMGGLIIAAVALDRLISK